MTNAMLLGVALIGIAVVAATVFWIRVDVPYGNLRAPTPDQALLATLADQRGIVYALCALVAAIGIAIILFDRRSARRSPDR
jgi:hypothetical protein